METCSVLPLSQSLKHSAIVNASVGLEKTALVVTLMTPAYSSMMGAAQQVLGTTELTEQILFCLPIHDLVRARRINIAIRATIKGSSKLQQSLYLRIPHDLAMQPSAAPGKYFVLSPSSNGKARLFDYVHAIMSNPLFFELANREGIWTYRGNNAAKIAKTI